MTEVNFSVINIINKTTKVISLLSLIVKEKVKVLQYGYQKK